MGERKRGRGRSCVMDWLPPTCPAPAENQTCDLLVQGATLQFTQPPGQGCLGTSLSSPYEPGTTWVPGVLGML